MSDDLETTQPIPVMTLAEVLAEWAAEQAKYDERQAEAEVA